MSGEIEVVDYDPGWVAAFDLIQARVRLAMGGLAAAIKHVGSTAVPGLAAKPIIDVDVLLADGGTLAEAVTLLGSIGYRHVGDLGIMGREAFDPPADLPDQHLYVCLQNSTEFNRHLAFRDYLRANPDAARQYGSMKKRLAVEFRNDRDAYTEAKTSFVEEMLRRSTGRTRSD